MQEQKRWPDVYNKAAISGADGVGGWAVRYFAMLTCLAGVADISSVQRPSRI